MSARSRSGSRQRIRTCSARTSALQTPCGGNIIFGGAIRAPVDLDAIRANVDPNITLHQVAQLRRLVPALDQLRVIRVWSGIEGYMRDDIPVMGRSVKMPGLFYAFGFCGHGFQLGPAVGEVMAEMIDTGATTTPIDPFHIGRFAADPVTQGSRVANT